MSKLNVERLLCSCGRKRPRRRPTCNGCWQKCHRIRAVAFPVLSVIDGGTLDEFGTAMMDGFRLSTDTYNWAVRQMLQADAVRGAGMENIPPRQRLDLYRLYNEAGCPCGDMATQSRTALFALAESEYGRHRRAALWDGEENLPLKRFPAPFPIHNQGWQTIWLDARRPETREEQEEELADDPGEAEVRLTSSLRPAISFRLHGEESGPRWTVLLASGRTFARQRADFRWMMANGFALSSAKCPYRMQLDLYLRPCGNEERGATRNGRPGRHRGGLVLHVRRPGGYHRIPMMLVAKLVGWFPRQPKADAATGVLSLVTDPNAFLVAQHDGRVVRPWILNEDQVQRWFAEIRESHQRHAVFVQRIAEDLKMERRTRGNDSPNFEHHRNVRVNRHRRRIATWLKQIAAQVAGYAQRQRLEGIVYDDINRDWLPRFPWDQLRTALREACFARRLRPGGALELADDTSGAAAT